MISASLVANEAIMGQQVATPPPGDWGPGLSAGSPPEGGIAWVGVGGGAPANIRRRAGGERPPIPARGGGIPQNKADILSLASPF